MVNGYRMAFTVGAVLAGAGAVIAGFVVAAVVGGGSGPWLETFDGAPSTPEPFTQLEQEHWDIQVHSRNPETYLQLTQMQGHHGPNCEPPGHDGSVRHQIVTTEQHVYRCADHVMTAIDEGGYGVIYLTPDRMVDFENGATIQIDISTWHASQRDWIDIFITPWADNMALPLDNQPDLKGEPRNTIHVREQNATWKVIIWDEYQQVLFDQDVYSGWNTFHNDSAQARKTLTITLSPTHIRVEFLGRIWADADISPPLDWTQGIVQIGHHSYTPDKGACMDGCDANTWHWDNVSISDSVPFKMIKADKRFLPDEGGTLVFNEPSPADSYLRFSAVGLVDVSYDGGATWERASIQPGRRQNGGPEAFSSYWHPIPAGVQTIDFRFFQDRWYNRQWAKDFAIWSTNLTGGPPATPTPTATATALPPTPTATATPVPPTATPTPEPTATATSAPPTPTSTAVPTATATPTAVPPTSTPTSTVEPTATSAPADVCHAAIYRNGVLEMGEEIPCP